jgi:hypothetical protein
MHLHEDRPVSYHRLVHPDAGIREGTRGIVIEPADILWDEKARQVFFITRSPIEKGARRLLALIKLL